MSGVGTLAGNVSGLCDGGAIEAQIFNFAQKLNRRTTVELLQFRPTIAKPLLYAVFISIRLLVVAILSKMSSILFCQNRLLELSFANLFYKNSQLGLRNLELSFYKCPCR